MNMIIELTRHELWGIMKAIRTERRNRIECTKRARKRREKLIKRIVADIEEINAPC